jgi:hypothetical protein
MHITDGIDVDQEPYSRDNEQHDARQRVDEIGEIDGEIAAEDPLIDDNFMRRPGPYDVGKHADRAEKRQTHRSPSKSVYDLLGIPPAEESVQEHGEQGKHRNELYQ